MTIAVDGGGLCAPVNKRFGNYYFSYNLINSLGLYDNDHQYDIYTFCGIRDIVPRYQQLRIQVLRPKIFWSSLTLSIAQIINPHDIYLGLNQAIPLISCPKVITFSHGTAFVKYPEYYRASYQRMSNQLKTLVNRSTIIIVPSTRIKQEIIDLYPSLSPRKIVPLPYGVPADMLDTQSNYHFQQRKKNTTNYFLYVGMNHPIKNIQFLISAFGQLIKKKQRSDCWLYIVGNFNNNLGKQIKVIPLTDRQQLKQLYCNATAYITTAVYESFNLPVLEALAQSCPVIGLSTAIIPEFADYVNVADNKSQLISLMELALKKQLPKVNSKQIIARFNWQFYVKQLTRLY